MSVEAYLCGHAITQQGCGGCDPTAIEFVRDDGGPWRRPTPDEEFDPTCYRLEGLTGGEEPTSESGWRKGGIYRFKHGEPLPRHVWHQPTGDFLELVWTVVPDPRKTGAES